MRIEDGINSKLQLLELIVQLCQKDEVAGGDVLLYED